MKPEIPSAQMVMNGWADGSADKAIAILGAEAPEFLSLRVMEKHSGSSLHLYSTC